MVNEAQGAKGTFSESYNINKYDVVLRHELFECRVFWARIISSESETLFTNATRHTFFEMQYALEGRIGMRLDGDRHVYISESDFLVVPPDTWHQITDGDSEGARFILAFSVTEAAPALSDRLRSLGSLNVFHETPGMRTLLSLLVGKNYHDTPVRKGIISSLLECFILEMLEAVSPARGRLPDAPLPVPGGVPSPATAADADSRVRAIAGYIHEYNGVGLTVADLARRFGMSERQLCRVVTSGTGKSPKELINHEKLCKIEELITSTDLSFTEISALCGFSDEYAMNKFFKRCNRVSLSYFRRLSDKKRE